MVEYLPTTHKVLDSILSTANAQTKKIFGGSNYLPQSNNKINEKVANMEK
jgi:hypothetical protein